MSLRGIHDARDLRKLDLGAFATRHAVPTDPETAMLSDRSHLSSLVWQTAYSLQTQADLYDFCRSHEYPINVASRTYPRKLRKDVCVVIGSEFFTSLICSVRHIVSKTRQIHRRGQEGWASDK